MNCLKTAMGPKWMIATDYLLHDGRAVFHLMGAVRVDAAKMSKAARADSASLVYPALKAAGL